MHYKMGIYELTCSLLDGDSRRNWACRLSYCILLLLIYWYLFGCQGIIFTHNFYCRITVEGGGESENLFISFVKFLHSPSVTLGIDSYFFLPFGHSKLHLLSFFFN